MVAPVKRPEIALKTATLGRTGLDINDPDSKYNLKTLPGTYSGLNLLAIVFAAFHQMDPTMETGADFRAGYAAALTMRMS